MDRVIEVKVNGSHLKKDHNLAGVQGEANATYLRIEFDEGWDGYAKTVVWLDARGEKSVGRMLTADMLEDITQSARIYLAPVPGEVMTEWGEILFAIDGYINGKRQRSVYGKLNVKPGDEFAVLEDVTPSQAEQLQAQIDGLMGDIQAQAIIAHDAATAAGGHAQAAATSETNAQQAAADAQAARTSAETAQRAAEGSAAQAASLALSAANSAEAASSGAWAANNSAERAMASETNAAASALAAHNSEQSAMARAQEADAAASRAESAQGNVEANAKAAQTAETGAKAAQAAAENASHTALEDAKRELSGYVNDGKSAAAAAQTAKTAAESSASRATAIAQSVEGYVNQAESSAQAASASADEAERRAFAAATSETNAASSAASASSSAETATTWAQYAETAAEYVAQARNDVRDLEGSTAQNAAAAADSATAAQTAETNAKAAQKAAEDARDAASEIAGGDFASHAEARGYVTAHNAATDAHADLRQAIAGAVKKSGDTMGSLGVTSLDFVNDRMYGSISPEGSMAKMQIIVGDKVAGGDCMLEIMPGGLRFTDTDYIERTVIHTGNLAQYMGVAQASLE